MVSKITIFEPHVDGAQFGPASMDVDRDNIEESGEELIAENTEERIEANDEERIDKRRSRRSRGRRILGAGVVSAALLAAIVVARRFRSDARPHDEPAVEIEQSP